MDVGVCEDSIEPTDVSDRNVPRSVGLLVSDVEYRCDSRTGERGCKRGDLFAPEVLEQAELSLSHIPRRYAANRWCVVSLLVLGLVAGVAQTPPIGVAVRATLASGHAVIVVELVGIVDCFPATETSVAIPLVDCEFLVSDAVHRFVGR